MNRQAADNYRLASAFLNVEPSVDQRKIKLLPLTSDSELAKETLFEPCMFISWSCFNLITQKISCVIFSYYCIMYCVICRAVIAQSV
jgi:hypothetical protein